MISLLNNMFEMMLTLPRQPTVWLDWLSSLIRPQSVIPTALLPFLRSPFCYSSKHFRKNAALSQKKLYKQQCVPVTLLPLHKLPAATRGV